MKAYNIWKLLQKADVIYRVYLKYVGMVLLLKAVFSNYATGPTKTWEEYIEESLNKLGKKEKRILKLRFGLQDNQMRTLGEVGKEVGITRERVRQIEVEAIKKLKRLLRKRFLSGEFWKIEITQAKKM